MQQVPQQRREWPSDRSAGRAVHQAQEQNHERGRHQGQQQTSHPQGAKPKQWPGQESVQSVRSDGNQGAGGGARGGAKGGAPRGQQTRKPSSYTGGKKPQKTGTQEMEFQEIEEEKADKLVVGYKGHGTMGKPLLKIKANYLKLNLDKLVPYFYHYDVDIEPDHPKKYFKHAFLEFRRTYFPGELFNFDGRKNAYTLRELNFAGESFSGRVTIIHPETGKELNYEITIQAAENSETSTMELTMAEQ